MEQPPASTPTLRTANSDNFVRMLTWRLQMVGIGRITKRKSVMVLAIPFASAKDLNKANEMHLFVSFRYAQLIGIG